MSKEYINVLSVLSRKGVGKGQDEGAEEVQKVKNFLKN